MGHSSREPSGSPSPTPSFTPSNLLSSLIFVLATTSLLSTPTVARELETFDCAKPNQNVQETMPVIVSCENEFADRILAGGDAVPDFDEKDHPYGDYERGMNRFKMALAWQEAESRTPGLYKDVECPMVKHMCCPGWKGATCEENTCLPCCVEAGGRCSALGQCMCPKGKSGECCEKEQEARVGGEGTLFQDSAISPNAPFATCAHQSSLLRSWDGRSTKLRLNCRYILATDGGSDAADDAEGWMVEAQNQCDGATCRKQLWISLPSQKIEALGRSVSVNGQAVPDDQGYIADGNGLNIQRDEEFTYMSTSMGLRLKWDNGANVFVTVEKELSGRAFGLCGVFDFNPKNDFTPFNKKPSDSNTDYQKFVESFKSQAGGECDEAMEFDACGKSARKSEAQSRCQILLTDPSFKPARDEGIDPDFFSKACQFDFCSLNGENEEDDEAVVCHYLTAYALEAARFGIRLDNWRRHGLCERSCQKANAKFTECRSNCPKTCGMKHRIQDDDCFKDCHPGCECAPGFFMDKGECVPEDACPCYYNRNPYQTGEVIKQRCNKCTCNKGDWDCEREVCTGTCSVVGHSQITTFDGKTYRQRGECEYALVEPIEDGPNKRLAVYMKKHSCSGGRCQMKLRIQTRKTEILLESGTDTIMVNGLPVAENIYRNPDIHISRENAFFTILKGFGFYVEFNHDSIVYITLSPVSANKVRGLCGTFNWQVADDFLTAAGNEENNEVTFAQSYMTYKDACPGEKAKQEGSFCSRNDAMRNAGHELCQYVKKQSGPYAACHAVIPNSEIEAYYYDCVESSCEANDLHEACLFLQDVAHRCVLEGANVTWAQDPLISQQCQSVFSQCRNGQLYTDCANACGHTCGKKEDNKQCITPSKECLPGCECPAGQIFDEHASTCVEPNMCTCYDHFSRAFVNSGDSVERGCNICMCEGGEFKCTEKECEESACPGNQEYLEDVSPCFLTCQNFDRLDQADCPGSRFSGCGCPEGTVLNNFDRLDQADCPGSRFSGCGCPEGTVLNGENCVKHDECPCIHGAKEYPHGSTYKRDCNTCQCLGKFWNCTHEVCEGNCLAMGDPHYITFDGTRFSFEGKCEYILAKDDEDNFAVHASNVACGSSGSTCTKDLTLHLYKPNARAFTMVRGRKLQLDGQDVNVPYIENDGALKVYNSGLWLVLVTDFGLRLMWDGATRVQITAKPSLKRHLSGVCGTYDGNQKNDLTTPAGDVQNDPYLFAESWKTNPECQDVGELEEPMPACEKNPHRAAWAKRSCLVLFGHLFKRCREELGEDLVAEYRNWCKEDSCSCDSGGDCECLCTSIAAFAEECNRVGIPVRWRSQHLCPMQCDHGMEYMACGSACPQTCHGLQSPPDDFCTTECKEGCFCPEGQVLEGNSCIPAEECPCYDGNLRYNPGTLKVKDCQDCMCVNGSFNCVGEKCENATTCAPGSFQCLSAPDMCVPGPWLCDGNRDCPDGSDEENCPVRCEDGEFLCADGECISAEYKCDGQPDCADYSDEDACPMPLCDGMDDFECSQGMCVPMKLRCDGRLDCGLGDKSDEENCAPCADVRQFQCGPTMEGDCSPIELKCDGHDDCGDMSDEIGCNGTCHHQFTCSDMTCIDPLRRCDGVKDCSDDEENCSTCEEGQFACTNGTCIEASHLCDGVYDCALREDERHPDCKPTTPVPVVTCAPNQMSCNDGSCVHGARCDGVMDCVDDSDEEGCLSTTAPCLRSEFTCGSGECVPMNQTCDSVHQCADKSDESSDLCVQTTPKSCQHTMFQCTKEFQCVPSNFRCDCSEDCRDGSDEEDCLHKSGRACLTTKAPTTTAAPSTTPPAEIDDLPKDCHYSVPQLESTDVMHFGDDVTASVKNPSNDGKKGDIIFEFPVDRDFGGFKVQAKAPTFLTITPLDADGNVISEPAIGPVNADVTPTDVVLDETVEGVRSVRITDEFGGRVPLSELLEITIVACIHQAPSTVKTETAATTTTPLECEEGFFQCGMEQCIPESSVCDGNKDCEDGSDEPDHCKKPTEKPPLPCQYFMSKAEMQAGNLSKSFPDGAQLLRSEDGTQLKYEFVEAVDLTKIFGVLSHDAEVELKVTKKDGSLRGPPKVITFDWQNYKEEFEAPYTDVSGVELNMLRPLKEGEEPKWLFTMAIACKHEEGTTVAPPTPPCDDFECADATACVEADHVCDGVYDCADESDETEEACHPPSTTKAPTTTRGPTTTEAPRDCVFKTTGDALSDGRRHLFEGAQIKNVDGKLVASFDEPREVSDVDIRVSADQSVTVELEFANGDVVAQDPVAVPAGEDTNIPVNGGEDVVKVTVSPVDSDTLEELEVVACEHRTTTLSTTAAVSTVGTTRGPIPEEGCMDGFVSCPGIPDECIPNFYECDGIPHCLDASDEHNGNCDTEPPPPPEERTPMPPCTHYATYEDIAERATIDFGHGKIVVISPTEIQMHYNEPTSIQYVIALVTDDAMVEIAQKDANGQLLGPKWVVRYDWYHYIAAYPNAVDQVSTTVMKIKRGIFPRTKPEFFFAMVIGCTSPEPAPTTPPPASCTEDQFTCSEQMGCVDLDHVCDGQYDCADQTDEAKCVTTTVAPPPSLPPTLSTLRSTLASTTTGPMPDCIYALNKKELASGESKQFDGIVADVLEDGRKVVFLPEEPAHVTEIGLTTSEPTTIKATFFKEDGTEDVKEIPVSEKDEKIAVDAREVVRVEIAIPDNVVLEFIEINACSELDCVHKVNVAEDGPPGPRANEINPGVQAKGTPDKITFLFDVPEKIYGVTVDIRDEATVVIQGQQADGSTRIQEVTTDGSEETIVLPTPIQVTSLTVTVKGEVFESVEIHACEIVILTTTAVTPSDCIHTLDMESQPEPKDSPVEINPGVSAKGSRQRLTFLLDEPREVFGVSVRTSKPSEITLKATDEDGKTDNVGSGATRDDSEEEIRTDDGPVLTSSFTVVVKDSAAKLDFVELHTCTSVTVPQEAEASPKTTTGPLDCIYEVNADELAKDEPTPFDGVEAVLTPDGKIEYTFVEPAVRTVTEVKLTSPAGDNPFQIVPVNEDGQTGVPVPLSSEPNEPTESFVVLTDVTKVVVEKKDGSPITPEDIISLEVVACGEGFTMPTWTTSPTPKPDCVYEVVTEDLESGLPVEYAEGITSALTTKGDLVFTFPEPRDVTEITSQTPDGQEFSVVPVTKNGEQKPQTIVSGTDAPQSSPLVVDDVTKLIISNPDGSPITPEEIISLLVEACKEVTTPKPSKTTTPPQDCVHSVAQEEIAGDNSVDKPNYTAELNADGRIVVTFTEPKDVSEVMIQAREGKPLEAVPVTADGAQAAVPLESNPNELIGNDVTAPGAESVTIQAVDGSPLAPEDIDNIVVIACVHVSTTAGTPGSTTTMIDCIYEVNAGELASDEPTPFVGVEAVLTPDGKIEYTFTEPDTRDVSRVVLTSPAEDSPFEIVPVGSDGKPGEPQPLSSTPNEPTSTDVDLPEVTKVVIQKKDGSPITPEDITSLEVVACKEAETTPKGAKSTTPGAGTTTPKIDCIYEVNTEELSQDEPTPFVGVEAVLTPDGKVEYTFTEPEVRDVSEVILTSPAEDSPFEIVPVSPDGTVGEPTPLSSTPDESTKTNVDLPEVNKVVIQKKDGSPITPEDITSLEVIACPETTTPKGGKTSTPSPTSAVDCIYEVNADELAKDEPTPFDGVEAVLTPDGKIEYTFTEPETRDVTEVILTSPAEDSPFEIVPVGSDGKPGEPQPLSSTPNEPTSTDVDLPEVSKVVIQKKDGTPITPEDITSLEVVACKEAETTPKGGKSTTPGAGTTTPKIDCIYEVNTEELSQDEPTPFVGVEAVLTPDGKVEYTFTEPEVRDVSEVILTSPAEDSPFEIVPVSPDGTVGEPTPLSSTPDESTKTNVDLPEVNKVVIQKKDGSPITPEDITSLEVIACPETTTPKGGKTSTPSPTSAVDCIYEVNADELAKDEPTPFDGVEAVLTPDGKIEYTFTEPDTRDVTEVILTSPAKDSPFEIVPVGSDGKPGEPQPLSSTPNEPTSTDVDLPEVSKVVIQKKDGTPITPEDITSLEVVACKEAETTPKGGKSTTPGAGTTTPKIDCIYEVNTEELSQDEPTPFVGVEAVLTPDGKVEYTFTEPEVRDVSEVILTSPAEDSPFEIVPVSPDGTVGEPTPLSSTPDESTKTNVDLPEVNKVVIQKKDGSPITPEDITSLEVIACPETTTPKGGKTSTPSPTSAVDCIYEVNADELAKDEPTPFDGVEAVLTPDGKIEYTFTDPETRDVTEVILTSPAEDSPFEIVPVGSDGKPGEPQPLSSTPNEPTSTDVDLPEVTKVVIQKKNGTPITPEDITSLEVVACKEAETTPKGAKSTTPGAGTTTSKIDCIYEVNTEELSQDEPTPFVGVEAVLTPDGKVEYTFTEPEVRDVSEVILTSPAEDSPFEIVPVSPDGTVGEPTPLSSTPDESTKTNVDLPEVTKVVIQKKDGSPITPEDITSLEVIACPETTTPKGGKTSTPSPTSAVDCIYEVNADELARDEPTPFDGVEAVLTPDGKIEYTFTEPQTRDVTEVILTSPAEDSPFEIVPVGSDGKPGEPQPLSSTPNEPTSTDVDLPEVTKVVIQKKDGTPITPEDITSLEVVACKEAETTPKGGKSTTPGAGTTTPKIDCIYEVNTEELSQDEPTPFVGVEAVLTPDGKVEYTFTEPEVRDVSEVILTSPAEDSPFEIVPVSPDGTVGEPTPLSSTPDESTKTNVDLPEVNKVVIQKKDGSPITPEDITSLEVIACPETTTPKGGKTSTPSPTSAVDCIYEVNSDELAKDEPTPFDGVEAVLTPDGKIEYTFTDPETRDVTEVILTSPAEDSPFEIVPIGSDGKPGEPQPLSSTPNEPTSTDVDLPEVTKVVIQKKDGTPITPEDITSLEVVACKEAETTPKGGKSTTPGAGTTTPKIDCIYEVNTEELSQDEPTPFVGVEAVLTPDGKVEYTFTEPEVRDVSEVILTSPTEDSPFEIVPVSPDGTVGEPTPLSSTPDESTKTNVDLPEVNKVVIQKKDGSPITPEDITSLEVIACPETTTPKGGKTSTPSPTSAVDCIYEVNADELAKDEPTPFDGVEAVLTPDGKIEYTFTEPETRDVTEVILTSPAEDSPFEIVPVGSDGKPGEPQPLSSTPNEPTSTDVDLPEVSKVVIQKKDGTPITPEDITSLEVVACKEAETTPKGGKSTTPGAGTTTPKIDCIYEVNTEELSQDEPTPFVGVEAVLTPDGKVEYTFTEPEVRDVSEVILTSPAEDSPFEIVPVSPDGTVGEPTPLSSTPDESTKTNVDLPEVNKVVIQKKDGSPITPEDITSLEVIACPESTTPKGTTTAPTTVAHLDCEYVLETSDVVAKKAAFTDAEATVVGDNQIKFSFESPKQVTSIRVQTGDGSPVDVLVVSTDKTESEEKGVPSGTDEPEKTELPSSFGDVVEVVVTTTGPVADIAYLEIVGCDSVSSTVATGETPETPCLHFVSAEDANSDEAAMTRTYITDHEDDKKTLAIFFNGPADLAAITLSTEGGESFTLQVSTDGETFETYDQPINSGADSLVGNVFEPMFEGAMAIKLTVVGDAVPVFKDVELEACMEPQATTHEPEPTGFGGGVWTTPSHPPGWVPTTVNYETCKERLNIAASAVTATSGDVEGAVNPDTVTDLWTAEDGDTDEAVIIDLGEDMDVTGFLVRTKNIQKIAVVPGKFDTDGKPIFNGNKKLILPYGTKILNNKDMNEVSILPEDVLSGTRLVKIVPHQKVKSAFALPPLPWLAALMPPAGATLSVDAFACLHPTTAAGSTTAVTEEPPKDCIYEVTPEDLAKDEPKEFDGVTAELTPDGKLVYTFDEPRDVSQVDFTTPDEGVVFELKPVPEDGSDRPATPLSSKPDEKTTTPLDEPAVTQVIIQKRNGDPIKPEEITALEVIACKEPETTVSGGTVETEATEEPPKDCIYEVTPEDLAKDEPKEFDGVTAELTPDGKLVYTFDEPRDVSQVDFTTPDEGVVFELKPVPEDGSDRPATPLSSKPDEKTTTPLDEPAVTQVIIQKRNGDPIKPEEITALEVIACKEPETTVSGATVETEATEEPPKDCIYEVTPEDLAKDEPKEFDGVTAELTPDGKLVYTFDEPRDVSQVDFTTPDEGVVFELKPVPEDGSDRPATPLSSKPDEKTTTPLDEPAVTQVIIQKRNGDPIKPEEITALEVIACKEPETTVSGATVETEATEEPPKDCIYEVTPEDLAKDEPKEFDGVTAELTPDGKLVYTFDEPRDVSQVDFTTPDEGVVFELKPVPEDGSDRPATPLSSKPDEKTTTPLDEPAVTQVIIQKRNGNPIKPEEITALEVIACKEPETTVSGATVETEATEELPKDCIYEVTPEDLAKDEPKEFDGVTAELTPDGKLVYTFDEPRDVSQVDFTTPDEGVVFELKPVPEDGSDRPATPLSSKPDEKTTTPLDEPAVTQVIIQKRNGDPIKPEEITALEVIACKEPETTVSGATVETEATEEPPKDCIYEVTPEDLAKDEPKEFDGVTAELTPDGKLVYTFDEPRDVSKVDFTTPDEGVVFELKPVPEDGSDRPATPLSSKPDEKTTTPLDEPAVTQVIIQKRNGDPITPAEITALEVVACIEASTTAETTPKMPKMTTTTGVPTTTPNPDCVYVLEKVDIKSKSASFSDADATVLDNKVKISFLVPKQVTSVTAQTKNGSPVDVTVVFGDRSESVEEDVPTGVDEPEQTQMPDSFGDVVEVIVEASGPVEDIKYLEIVGCDEVATTPGEAATTPHECSSDVSSDLGNDAFETSSAPEEAKKAKPNRRGWQPAADDAEPTLTVRLPGPTRVSAVSVRSAFQSLSVQVQETDGGDFVDVKTIEEPESDELSETLLDEPILAIAVRIVVADKGDDESAALNVVVHGCYEASTTFGTTQKPMPCLHFIVPDEANSDGAFKEREYIVDHEDDRKTLVVFFNGPTSLKDVVLATEGGESFKLFVSQDGENFDKYDKVIESGVDELIRNELEPEFAGIRALKLSVIDSDSPAVFTVPALSTPLGPVQERLGAGDRGGRLPGARGGDDA